MSTNQGNIPRAFRLGLAVSMLLLPASAYAANPVPIIDSVTFSPSPVSTGTVTNISCAAHDESNITQMQISVSAGTLPGGVTVLDVPVPISPSVVGTVAWNTPAAGSYTVTCRVWDDAVGSPFGIRASRTLAQPVTVTQPVGSPPVLDALAASATQVLPGETVVVTAAAQDPDGDPLTYAWSATVGTLVPNGNTATWTAPGAAGSATISVVVSDGTGNQATGSVVVSTKLALWGGAMPVQLVAPTRIALNPNGDFEVIDATTGQLALLAPNGGLKSLFKVPGVATSLTHCFGALLVATTDGKVYRVGDQGEVLGQFTVAGVPLAWPAGMACDIPSGLLLIAERNADRIRAVRADGSIAMLLTQAGAEPLAGPVDVAVDATARRIWVLLDSYQDGTAQQLHSFAFDGTWQTSTARYGGAAGRVTRGSGLVVGASGRLYVSDAFQSRVLILDATGAPLDVLGSYGIGEGKLKTPSGVVLHPRGDLVVANTGNGRLEFYGNGQPLPGCPGDADCDGLPDAWELLHGFNPNDPRDALADTDADGLTNLQELAWGTNPRNRDTDGDGYTDGEEVAMGKNPLDPNDHVPVLVALSTPDSDPGLVRLDAQLQGRGTCTVAWTQTSGPTVALRDDTSATPGFISRAVGTYVFSGTPSCNGVTGAAATVSAKVRDAAPRADASRVLVVPAGESFWLDGAFSWDPNGTALSFLWDQTAGPPRLSAASAADVWVRAHQPGLYQFQLEAKDGAGNTGAAEVPVLVVSPARPAPTAVANTPVQGVLGNPVTLDASGSVGPVGARLGFAWRQAAGTNVALQQQPGGLASFTPPAAGHYRFEVSALDGTQQSPWAPVDVYVAESGAGLPVAVTDAARAGTVGEPLTLSGVQSTGVGLGATLTYRWRQVSGPAAGLTDAAKESATVVPFSPGTAVFELVVRQGDMQSVPALVTVTAEVTGQARPQAKVQAPAVASVGAEVVLDGLGSSGTGGTLRYRWTQVSGPWVPLDEPRGAVAAFAPRLPGLYVFELEVDDGATRSAPASVGVLVFPAAAEGGR